MIEYICRHKFQNFGQNDDRILNLEEVLTLEAKEDMF